MEQYAGIDVSLDSASVCIVDAQGKIVKEAKVASEPDALVGCLRGSGVSATRPAWPHPTATSPTNPTTTSAVRGEASLGNWWRQQQ